METIRVLSKKDLEQAQRFGGADLTDYEIVDELRSCDKGNHLQRSLVLQPNHEKCKKLKRGDLYDRRK